MSRSAPRVLQTLTVTYCGDECAQIEATDPFLSLLGFKYAVASLTKACTATALTGAQRNARPAWPSTILDGGATRRTRLTGGVYCGACSAFPEPPLERVGAGGFAGLGR